MKYFFLILFSFPLFAANLSFKFKGKEIKTLSLDEIKKLQTSEVKLFNVFRGYERTYEGLDFYSLLDSVYGKDWRTSKKITFIALDGYNQFSWIKKMIVTSKDKQAFLAFTEKGKEGFTLIEKEGKKIDPAPFYLVWTNFTEKDKASHADALKWPYQLAAINID